MSISPETYNELRRFIRENAPMQEDEGEEMPPDMGGPPAGVAIEVKSEPEPGGGGKTCPTCGHPMP